MIEVNEKPRQSIIRKDNVRPFKTPAQKKQLRIMIGLIVVIVVIAVIAYYLIIPKQKVYQLNNYDSVLVRKADLVLTTQASGAVAIPVQLNALCPESAYVERLFTAEGDSITKGQLLVTLSANDLQQQLDDLTSTLDDSKRNLEKTQIQNRYTIQKMERDLVTLEKQVTDALAEVRKTEELVKINASRKSDLEAKQTVYDDLVNKQSESNISLKQEKELQSMDIDMRKAAILQSETKISRLHERIAALAVKAPMSGDILSMEKALAVPGSFVSLNQTLFTIADPYSAIIELEVLEDYSGSLAMGQAIALTVGGQEMQGKIISIGKVATASSDGLGSTVQVKVKPVSGSENLLLGSSAVGTIVIGTRPQTLIIPRGPYLTTGNQKYLYKITGNRAVRVEVTYGVTQGNDVEIFKGVEAGDTIITSGYQNFIEYKEIQLRKGE